jgi:hypothetical protein
MAKFLRFYAVRAVSESMKDKYDLALKAFLLLAIVLRLALFWVTPPQLALDNHYEPILLFLNTGEIPDKFACFQCYQPPVFYAVSALFGKIFLGLGAGTPALFKFLQFINCLFDVLTVWVAYLIMRRLPLSGFARTIAFGTLALLPRHIYMAAMHGNDTLAYLLVALSLYLLLFIVERRDRPIHLVLLSVAISAALFTKYTTFALLPAVALTLLMLLAPPFGLKLKQVAAKGALVLLLPLVLFTGYMAHNQQQYGTPLPYNDRIYDPATKQPRDPGGADFTSFKPWLFVESPYLKPGQVSSFWTLVYSSMWFDTEPKFLMFMDSDRYWWIGYYQWLQGGAPYPEQPRQGSSMFMSVGSALESLGLVPLFLGVSGIAVLLGRLLARREWLDFSRYQMFLVLMLCNAAGIILLAMKMPVFTAMKGSYLLNSLPAFGVLIALGVSYWERYRPAKLVMSCLFSALFLVVLLHLGDLVLSMKALSLPS